MGKFQNKNKQKSLINQGKEASTEKASKINASTPHELTNDRITAFGGIFGLIKYFDLIHFEEIFKSTFIEPTRKPKNGCYSMLCGFIMLLFIGFSRLWHFKYVQIDPMICGIFNLTRLPDSSTYWRFLDSMGVNQSYSILKMNSLLRERTWQLCGFNFKTIHLDIDTTVETVFGDIEGARKGHNRKYRGKKGLRPIIAFIEETREYHYGKLRKGTTVSGNECAKFIRELKKYLPACVKNVILRADGEFISEDSCLASEQEGFEYIFANKRCHPSFKKKGWYRIKNQPGIEYNSCYYQPTGWSKKRHFVVMRILKDKENDSMQCELPLFEDECYEYRIFVTNKKGRPHKIIREYDKRANCENLIGESKREGLAAFPSKKFKNNHVFFQIVMLTFNLWRYLKFFATKNQLEEQKKFTPNSKTIISEIKITEHPIVKHTARIARLKLLFIPAKIVTHDHRTQIRYSVHDGRVAEFRGLLDYLELLRKNRKPWESSDPWNYNEIAA